MRGKLLLIIIPTVALQVASQDFDPNYTGTFSIIARDPATGELGMGVQSKSLGVGTRTISAKGSLAVIAHQASSNPMYGAVGLELLRAGLTPQDALDMMTRSDEGRNNRQVSILDIQGRSASWTGSATSDWKGHKCGNNYCAQGNTLTGPEVVEAMARSFESSSGPLAERLLAALDAAQAAGGDARGTQSCAILVVKPLAGAAGFSDRVVDIRVDDHRTPLVELRRILDKLRSGQMISEANTKLQSGNTTAALETALAARHKSPENDNVWVALANIYLKMGRKADALEAIRRAVELNPGNKRQLSRNKNFESLHKDPEFLRIVP